MSRRDGSVYVGRLAKNTRTRDLEEIFEPYGRLMRCDIKYGSEMAYAFIDFEDRRDAEDCVKYEHGREINGQSIIVEWAKGGKDRRMSRGGRSDSSSQSYDECFRCRRTGHWARDCPDLRWGGRRGGGGDQDPGIGKEKVAASPLNVADAADLVTGKEAAADLLTEKGAGPAVALESPEVVLMTGRKTAALRVDQEIKRKGAHPDLVPSHLGSPIQKVSQRAQDFHLTTTHCPRMVRILLKTTKMMMELKNTVMKKMIEDQGVVARTNDKVEISFNTGVLYNFHLCVMCTVKLIHNLYVLDGCFWGVKYQMS